MPEGHALHRLARRQQKQFGGQRVAVSSPQGRFGPEAALLDGLVFQSAEAWGKHLVYRFGASSLPDGDRSCRLVHIHLGIYGACSTFSEATLLGGLLIDSRSMDCVVCATSTHFSTAERQYRMPLELGTGRPPTAQRTTTAAGACVLRSQGPGVRVTGCTLGEIIDWHIKDANNMGAAMAPAAADTIAAHLLETQRAPGYYDCILTGDLGHHGSEVAIKLLRQRGFDISKNHADCGIEIYPADADAQSGGSGCGCSAVVFGAFYLKELMKGRINRLLLVSTGALLSPTSTLQGETIPGIAHAVAFESGEEG